MWERIVAHPIVSTACTLGIILVIGALFVQSKVAVSNEYTGSTIGIEPSSNTTIQTAPIQQTYAPTPSSLATDTAPIVIQSNAATSTTPPHNTAQAITEDDLTTLLNELTPHITHVSLDTASTPTTTDTSLNWLYIPPTMVISTTSPKSQTPLQQSLYQYGNDIGSIIQGFDATHTGTVQTLTNAINDRHDTTKEQAVERIGKDMINVGNGILAEGAIPDAAAAGNTALGNSYIASGKALIASAQAENQLDATYIAALQAYNKTSLTVIRAANALSLVFSLNQVSFSRSDPGSVFMFSGGGL